VFSAGTKATEVNPLAISALEEINIDTSGLWSKSVDTYLNHEFDEVVTVCDNARESCPFFPGARKYTHQGFCDPPELIDLGMEPMRAFRAIRDEIKEWILDHFS
jgi:arsenate reductase